MADNPAQSLQDRIEEGAREVWPIWEWLLFLWLVGLPILLGYVYAALAERAAGGPLPWQDYQTILYVKGGFTAAMFVAVVVVSIRGWHRKLIGWSDPKTLAPGPFRLGAALIGIYYRPWWNPPLVSIGLVVLIGLVDTGETETVPEIFWMSQALFGWFFASAVALLGLVLLVGMVIQPRLGEKGGPS